MKTNTTLLINSKIVESRSYSNEKYKNSIYEFIKSQHRAKNKQIYLSPTRKIKRKRFCHFYLYSLRMLQKVSHHNNESPDNNNNENK